jgi:hypothetical protein
MRVESTHMHVKSSSMRVESSSVLIRHVFDTHACGGFLETTAGMWSKLRSEPNLDCFGNLTSILFGQL